MHSEVQFLYSEFRHVGLGSLVGLLNVTDTFKIINTKFAVGNLLPVCSCIIHVLYLIFSAQQHICYSVLYAIARPSVKDG